MRIQKSMGQLEAPDKMRDVRRDLARVKTVLRQKRRMRSARVEPIELSESRGSAHVSEVGKSRRRRQQQDAEEHRGRGRVAGAARAVRQDRAPDVEVHGARRGRTRRRWATSSRSSKPGRSAAASAGRSSASCGRRRRCRQTSFDGRRRVRGSRRRRRTAHVERRGEQP